MRSSPGTLVDIRVDIVAWQSDDQPGVMKCRLLDVYGKNWTFVEKVPVVTDARLRPDSSYPQPGILRGTVVGVRREVDGREIVTVDTNHPWAIEDIDGATCFDVRPDQFSNI